MGRRLTSGSRPVGRSTAVRCVGGGGVSKRGKGGSGPSSPSSLPLFYIEIGEAYASGGGGGRTALPPPPPFWLLQSIESIFRGSKNPKRKVVVGGTWCLGVTGRKIEQQKKGNLGVSKVGCRMLGTGYHKKK